MAKAKPSSTGTEIRRWLIITFSALVLGFVGSGAMGTIFPERFIEMPLYWVFQVTLWIGTVASFVLSIMHVVRYKEKGLAVTTLVISSIVVLILLLSFIAGIIIALSEIV